MEGEVIGSFGATMVVELLVIATAVALLTKFVRLPYTVALVIMGLGVGLSPVFGEISLSKELILMIFLPPLLFEGAINMDLEVFREHAGRVGLLAILGTAISTGLIGIAVHYLLSLPWYHALLLGAILSPTDPVSVLAIFKEFGVTKGLSAIVEGESLFNDGIGVVFYLILLHGIETGTMALVPTAFTFFKVAVGGSIVGFVLGYLTYRLLGKIDDHLIEVMISIALAYGVYVVAESPSLHMSGVLAVVVAGMIIGNFGRHFSMSPTTRLTLSAFWEVAAFIVNSILFLMIGIQLDRVKLWDAIGPVIALFVVAVIVRSLLVYPFLHLHGRFKRSIPTSWMHVVNWGGIRGSIPVALVMGLPADLEHRQTMVVVVFGVVLCSLLIQGMTIKKLLKRLGLVGAEQHVQEFEETLGKAIALKEGLRRLEEMHANGEIDDRMFEHFAEPMREQKDGFTREIGEMVHEHDLIRGSQLARTARQLLLGQRTAIGSALRRGLISEEVFAALREDVDLRIDDGSQEVRFWSPEDDLDGKDDGQDRAD